MDREAGGEAGKPREERVSRNKDIGKWLNCSVAIPLEHERRRDVCTDQEQSACVIFVK